MKDNWSNRKCSKEEFINAWNSSSTYREIQEKLGYCNKTSINKPKFIIWAKELDLDLNSVTDHSETSSVKSTPRRNYSLEDIFIVDSTFKNTVVIKNILKHDLIPYVCQQCNVGNKWNGLNLTLQLDHINGINNDHRLENLRFLCPNCHSQTDTYTSKRSHTNEDKTCSTEGCQNRLHKSSSSNICTDCISTFSSRNIKLFKEDEIDWESIHSSKEEFIHLWESSLSISQVAKKLRKKGSTRNSTYIKRIAYSIGLDNSHMKGQRSGNGKNLSKEDLLIKLKNNTVRITSNIKQLIIKYDVIPYQCELCNIDAEYNGKNLVLHLDHVDGVCTNNDISNLRFLCPNCHSQTDTFGSKNMTAVRNKTVYTCKNIDCNNHVSKNGNSCRECYEEGLKFSLPTKEEILRTLEENDFNYVQSSKFFKISDNGLRKRMKKLGIPTNKDDLRIYIRSENRH